MAGDAGDFHLTSSVRWVTAERAYSSTGVMGIEPLLEKMGHRPHLLADSLKSRDFLSVCI
jgi:hypothetical protein